MVNTLDPVKIIYTNIKRPKWADPNHLDRQIILSSGSNRSNVEHQTRCSDPTSDSQVSVLKCHPWIGMLTHTVLEDL